MTNCNFCDTLIKKMCGIILIFYIKTRSVQLFKDILYKVIIKRGKTAAVILAAGRGVRFGGGKQFARICGVPVLARTILAFDSCSVIDEIVVVASAPDVPMCCELVTRYAFKKVKCVVSGGETRFESALRGFEATSPDISYVAIHDGARCLILPEQIERVCREAYSHRAAAVATPALDTVKIADKNGFISETPDRSRTWLAGTPQVFYANLYRAAIYTVKEDDFSATDDAMLAERIGFKVKLVDIGRDNIKITYPCDIAIAEAILKERRRAEANSSGEKSFLVYRRGAKQKSGQASSAHHLKAKQKTEGI